MPDLERYPGFLEPATLARIRSAISAAGGGAANVYGDRDLARVDPLVRRTTQLAVPDDVAQEVTALLTAHAPAIERRFGTGPLRVEPPQFLQYGPGDYFVAHQDGNTPLIRDKARFRRVSIVIYVDADYSGGSLVLHEPYPNFNVRTPVEPVPGTLVAFRSETTHEVTPVERGVRHTIVSWYAVRES